MSEDEVKSVAKKIASEHGSYGSSLWIGFYKGFINGYNHKELNGDTGQRVREERN